MRPAWHRHSQLALLSVVLSFSGGQANCNQVVASHRQLIPFGKYHCINEILTTLHCL